MSSRRALSVVGLSLLLVGSASILAGQGIFLGQSEGAAPHGVEAPLFNFSHYSKEPAPVGIVDYGLGMPTSSGYYTTHAYNTTSFEGIVGLGSISTHGNSTVGNAATFQLNVVLVFNDSGPSYVYWVQNVAHVDTGNGEVTIINNIWNFTDHGAKLYNSSMSGNGTVENISSGVYAYEARGPGSLVDVPLSSTIYLKVVSYETSSKLPAVAFSYDDGYGWQTYDSAVFKFATHLTSDSNFVVTGSRAPLGGNAYDAELILAGPGNSENTTFLSGNVTLQLMFLNGSTYQEVPDAFSFGADTGETVSDVAVSERMVNGLHMTTLSTGNETFTELYNYENSTALPTVTGGGLVIQSILSNWPLFLALGIMLAFVGVMVVWRMGSRRTRGRKHRQGPKRRKL